MSDLDEIRSALGEATRAPGDMQARPGAAEVIRGEAIRRRQRRRAAGAVALSGCVVLVAAVFASGSLPGRDMTTQLPASSPSAVASATSHPQADLPIELGPRALVVPVTIHPVLREYAASDCPVEGVDTVPAAADVYSGADRTCLELGPASVTVREVRQLVVGVGVNAQGTTRDAVALHVTMTEADAAAYSDLTAAAHANDQRLAFVIGGEVYAAPTIGMRIPGGEFEIHLDRSAAVNLVTTLTGEQLPVSP